MYLRVDCGFGSYVAHIAMEEKYYFAITRTVESMMHSTMPGATEGFERVAN